MRKPLGWPARLLGIVVLALICPHPVSFREGGYLPVAVILPMLGDDLVDGALMLAICLSLYGIPLLLVSFLLFPVPKRSSAGTGASS